MNRRDFLRRSLYLGVALGLPAGVAANDVVAEANSGDVLTVEDLRRAKAALDYHGEWLGGMQEWFLDPKTRERLPDEVWTDYYRNRKVVRHYHDETLISEEVVEYPE